MNLLFLISRTEWYQSYVSLYYGPYIYLQVILCFPSDTIAMVGIFGHGIDQFAQYVPQEEDALFSDAVSPI